MTFFWKNMAHFSLEQARDISQTCFALFTSYPEQYRYGTTTLNWWIYTALVIFVEGQQTDSCLKTSRHLAHDPNCLKKNDYFYIQTFTVPAAMYQCKRHRKQRTKIIFGQVVFNRRTLFKIRVLQTKQFQRISLRSYEYRVFIYPIA